MLGVVFQNMSLKDCLQYFGKRDMLHNHLLLSVQGDTDILGKRLGLDSLQHGQVPTRTENYGVVSDMSNDKERRDWPHEKQPRASDYATLIRPTELPGSHVQTLFESV